MARQGWLSDNEHRAYPLDQEHQRLFRVYATDPPEGTPPAPFTLPYAALVDCGFLIGPTLPGLPVDPGYRLRVYLHKIARDGDEFSFHFTLASPPPEAPTGGPGDWYLIVSETLGAEPYTPREGTATLRFDTAERPPLSDLAEDWIVLEGWASFGQLDELADLLPDGHTAFADLDGDGELPHVEPACHQDLRGDCVTTLNGANFPRTVATDPGEEEDPEEPTPEEDGPPRATLSFSIGWTPATHGETHRLSVRQGYSIGVRQVDRENKLVFTAIPGAGAGEPCEDVKAFDEEEPPVGSILLSGGPSCNQVLHSINGSSGQVIRFSGGPGVTVAVDPEDPARLILDFTAAASRGV